MNNKYIRTLLAQLGEGHLLIPGATVAEIQSFTWPTPLKKAPAWVLGELIWNGWQVPVIRYDQLIGVNHSRTITSKARILIIKTLGESTLVNYIGLVIQGLPTLRKVTADALIESETSELHAAVFSEVSIDDLHAVIPELAALTRIVEEAAYAH